LKSHPRALLLSSAVVVVLLFCSSVVIADSESETETQTTTSVSSSVSSTVSSSVGSTASSAVPNLRFSMVHSPLAGGTNYLHGGGSATVQLRGTVLAIHLEAEGMKGGAHLTLLVLSNGTPVPVANMTADDEGEVEAEAGLSLAPGSYSIGLQVLDRSTFSSPTVVLVSNPQTQTVLVAGVPQSTATSSTSTETMQQVSTVHGGETEDDGITTAIKNKVIPAVVDLGQFGSSVQVNDGNFSVSVGQYEGGYLVSVFGANVTGPRVLLINLTSSQSRNLLSAPVSITLDGSAVQQGSSVSEVLGAKAGDPAMFILVSGPSALSLLISVPHFSYHVIEILPIITQAISALVVDLPVFLLGVAIVSAAVLVAYGRRTRVAL